MTLADQQQSTGSNSTMVLRWALACILDIAEMAQPKHHSPHSQVHKNTETAGAIIHQAAHRGQEASDAMLFARVLQHIKIDHARGKN